jgi:hypothetical protein
MPLFSLDELSCTFFYKFKKAKIEDREIFIFAEKESTAGAVCPLAAVFDFQETIKKRVRVHLIFGQCTPTKRCLF